MRRHPAGVTASVLALRDEAIRPAVRQVPRWEPAYVAALQRIGLDLRPVEGAESLCCARYFSTRPPTRVSTEGPEPGTRPAGDPLVLVPDLAGPACRPRARQQARGRHAAGLTLGDIIPLARHHDLAVLHTSSPTFAGDVKVAEALKAANPEVMVGFVGPKVAVQPDRSLRASAAIDFVAREEFDFTIAEVARGRSLPTVNGLSYKAPNGQVLHNPDRDILTDMDRLPYVTPVYKRDLRAEDYYIGYLLHPYVSLYTGRGCRSRCTFCLWPQTVGGHRYRTRSVANVLAEAALVRGAVPADEGAVLRRRHVYRQSPAGRGHRPRAGQARNHLVVQCQGERPPGDAEGLAGQRAAPAAGRLWSGNQQILVNIKKGLRVEGPAVRR